VPVLVGSCAYAVAEGAAWHGSMADKPKRARKFYAVMAFAMVLGLVLNYLGVNAVRMLFWSAVINGLLAPPLILLIIPPDQQPQSNGKAREPAATQMFRMGYLCGYDCGGGGYVHYVLNVNSGGYKRPERLS
jgi:Mn2+/Fe2+ NRAMP family transporter